MSRWLSYESDTGGWVDFVLKKNPLRCVQKHFQRILSPPNVYLYGAECDFTVYQPIFRVLSGRDADSRLVVKQGSLLAS